MYVRAIRVRVLNKQRRNKIRHILATCAGGGGGKPVRGSGIIYGLESIYYYLKQQIALSIVVPTRNVNLYREMKKMSAFAAIIREKGFYSIFSLLQITWEVYFVYNKQHMEEYKWGKVYSSLWSVREKLYEIIAQFTLINYSTKDIISWVNNPSE